MLKSKKAKESRKTKGSLKETLKEIWIESWMLKREPKGVKNGYFSFLDKARMRDSIWTQTHEVCTQRAIKALKSESQSEP